MEGTGQLKWVESFPNLLFWRFGGAAAAIRVCLRLRRVLYDQAIVTAVNAQARFSLRSHSSPYSRCLEKRARRRHLSDGFGHHAARWGGGRDGSRSSSAPSGREGGANSKRRRGRTGHPGGEPKTDSNRMLSSQGFSCCHPKLFARKGRRYAGAEDVKFQKEEHFTEEEEEEALTIFVHSHLEF